MSRSFGVRSLTTRSPMRISPSVISSSPATIRSAVVLPQPEGPTRTTNSPSAISRLRSSTASAPPPYSFETWANLIEAISGPSRDAVRVSLGGPLTLDRARGQPEGDPPLDQDEEDDHRQGGQGRARHQRPPVSPVQVREGGQPDGDRLLAAVVKEHIRN